MTKFWRSNEFNALNKEWEQRLTEAGFEDCEKEIAGERVLKQSSDYAYRRQECTEVYRESKLTYFMLLAEHLTKERSFEDESDRLIMTWTADGWTIQEISRELQRLGKIKHNRDTIRYIRRRYENKWGIKIWKLEQMVSRRVAIR